VLLFKKAAFVAAFFVPHISSFSKNL